MKPFYNGAKSPIQHILPFLPTHHHNGCGGGYLLADVTTGRSYLPFERTTLSGSSMLQHCSIVFLRPGGLREAQPDCPDWSQLSEASSAALYSLLV